MQATLSRTLTHTGANGRDLRFVHTAIDRACHLRSQNAEVDQLRRHTDTRYLVASTKNFLLLAGDPTKASMHLATLPAAKLEHLKLSALVDDASFLGLRTETHMGQKIALFVIDAAANTLPADTALSIDQEGEPVALRDLRLYNPFLSEDHSAIALYAKALTTWQRGNQFCPGCGSATRLEAAGHQRKCENGNCANIIFPRQDPAMIVLVESDCGQKVLLGRQAVWPEKVHSTLAGFVEVGETLEQAVVRETMEEVGAAVNTVKYMSSQPWPFPQSTMLGFRAIADATQPLVVDKMEMDGAAWFSREEVELAAVRATTMNHEHPATRAAVDDPAVNLLLPPPGTIARRLIDGWRHGHTTRERESGQSASRSVEAEAAAVVQHLKAHKQTITFCESSTGGLIMASLLAVPGASAVFPGGSVIYNSKKAGKLLLDEEVVAEQERTKDYSTPASYRNSKMAMTASSAKTLREKLGTTWCLSEGGAAGPTFNTVGITSGFTVLSLAGPNGFVATTSIDTGHADRWKNMQEFRDGAIQFLAKHTIGLCSKL